jgi:hypothetical protein
VFFADRLEDAAVLAEEIIAQRGQPPAPAGR